MDKQIENIDAALRKVFIIGLFLVGLLVFKSTDCSGSNSYNKKVTIESTYKTDNSAVLSEILSFSGFDNSLVSSHLFTHNDSNKEHCSIICSNNKTNILLLLSKKRFTDVVTHISEFNPHQIRASLSSDDIPSIS